MEIMPFEKMGDPKPRDGLTPLCGPHCGTKDRFTGHCPVCHRLVNQLQDAMEAHRYGRGYIGRLEV